MIHPARERFAALARRDDAAIDLAEGALLIAAEACDDLDVERERARLDALGAAAATEVATAVTPADRIARLNDFLYRREGFCGNRADYYDPRNSFLNRVLERRTGIPITLAVVYLEVARRAGVPAHGVNFPGHFLVRSDEAPELIVDPFAGRRVGRSELEALLRQALGPGAELQPAHLAGASARQILFRMLTNLKQVYCRAGELERALGCCDRLLLLAPDLPPELRDRGLIYAQLECAGAAVADLERYLELARSPEAARALAGTLATLRAQAANIH